MTQSSISLIMTAFGSKHEISRCYKSIVHYPKPSGYEIIVVDDCNDFDVKELLSPWDDGNTRFLRNEKNMGAQYSRRRGLNAAGNDFVMLIDGDDFLAADQTASRAPGFLNGACTFLREHAEIALVYSPTTMTGAAIGFTSSAYPASSIDVIEKHHVPIYMVRRRQDACVDSMYPDAILKWQDWHAAVALLNARLVDGKHNEIKYLNDMAYIYSVSDGATRISQTSVSELEMTELTISENLEIFKSHFKIGDPHVLAPLVLGKKPSLLDCLLRISNHDLEVAKAFVSHREIKIQQAMSRRIAP